MKTAVIHDKYTIRLYKNECVSIEKSLCWRQNKLCCNRRTADAVLNEFIQLTSCTDLSYFGLLLRGSFYHVKIKCNLFSILIKYDTCYYKVFCNADIKLGTDSVSVLKHITGSTHTNIFPSFHIINISLWHSWSRPVC